MKTTDGGCCDGDGDTDCGSGGDGYTGGGSGGDGSSGGMLGEPQLSPSPYLLPTYLFSFCMYSTKNFFLLEVIKSCDWN
jgi:hypothetical protein